MLDIHCHILPAVDDGARDAAMAHAMLARAEKAGITAIVATPHMHNSRAERRGVVDTYRALRESFMQRNIRLLLGWEVALQRVPEIVYADVCGGLCVEGTNSVLIELPRGQLPPGWDGVLARVRENGFYPIIVHPERVACFQQDEGAVRALVALGCEMQIDATGLFAPHWSAERQTARRILASGQANYIASDAHRPGDYQAFDRARRMVGDDWPKNGRLNNAIFLP